jgi:hypothetical protein
MQPGQQDTGSSQTPYTVPDIDDTLARAQSATEKVRVVHGANEGYYDLAGKTVGSVRKSLREVFNIPGDADALIGNKSVGDDFILEDGMAVEFIKEAGVKGRPE